MISFFNDTATTEIYTLSLHDALPISAAWASAPATAASPRSSWRTGPTRSPCTGGRPRRTGTWIRRTSARAARSEEHTSELQSRQYLVCRLLLEKKLTKHLLYQLPLHQ